MSEIVTPSVLSAVSSVVSSGDVERAKPDPGIVRKALDEAGIDPGRAVMVGDTIWDVLAAERAGIGCIGLLCGGTAEAELYDAGAVRVYRDPAALLGDIHASPIGRLRRGEHAPGPCAGSPAGGMIVESDPS